MIGQGRRKRAEALVNHLGDRKALLGLIENAVNSCRALIKLDGEWRVPIYAL